MKDYRNIFDKLTSLFKDQQSGKKLHRIIMMMAVTVVFMTTYLLILPAITLDEEAGHKLPGISLEGGSTSIENEGSTSPDNDGQIDAGQGEEAGTNRKKQERVRREAQGRKRTRIPYKIRTGR